MNRFERRLRKIEGPLPTIAPAFTTEELYIGHYIELVAWSRYEGPFDGSEIDQMKRKIVSRSKSIIQDARDQIKRTVSCQVHGGLLCGIDGKARSEIMRFQGTTKFIPPVVGFALDDLNVPNLFERRVAVRHCSVVTDIIGPPDEAVGVSDYEIRWDLIHEQIRHQRKQGNTSFGIRPFY